MPMPMQSLGTSGVEVSRLSLGSWRTFERISREQGVAVMSATREAGITFLDDARYNDESGSAPLRTGYSEVIFGELFREAGWHRDETIIANKLWWEFWGTENARQELDGSLLRMGLEYVDLIYAERRPAILSVEEAVHEACGLITAGKARMWGLLNWTAADSRLAHDIALAAGLPTPVATQLPYSLARLHPVESPEMVSCLDATGMSVVASFCLAGGVLTGKYATDPSAGRASGQLADERVAQAAGVARELALLAEEASTSSAALALAFVLSNPAVASLLFGATKPEQVHANAAAIEALARLDDAFISRLRAIATTG